MRSMQSVPSQNVLGPIDRFMVRVRAMVKSRILALVLRLELSLGFT